jgi:hypothetical protein
VSGAERKPAATGVTPARRPTRSSGLPRAGRGEHGVRETDRPVRDDAGNRPHPGRRRHSSSPVTCPAAGRTDDEGPPLLAERRAFLPGGWTDGSAAVSFRGFGLRRVCSVRTSPCGGRPSRGWRASRSAPIDVAASWVATPSPPFPRPRGVPSIGLPHRPKAMRRLPQASPPSQGSGRDVLTGPAGPGRPSWSSAPLQRHRSERSVSRGFASPATVRPRSFSLPRRVLLSPASRTRWVRCRSWGFDSEALSSAKAVTRRRVRCVLSTPARLVLSLSRAGGRTLRTLEDA